MLRAVNFVPSSIITVPNLCLMLPATFPSNNSTILPIIFARIAVKSFDSCFAKPAISFLAFSRSSLSFFGRLKSLVSITTPFKDGGAFLEASFTSPALSPKIARRSFSSGVGSDSPFGVILPIKISPSFTSEPTRITPLSSKFFTVSSATFGISAVNSSSPRFVSRTSNSNSSM